MAVASRTGAADEPRWWRWLQQKLTPAAIVLGLLATGFFLANLILLAFHGYWYPITGTIAGAVIAGAPVAWVTRRR